MKTALLFFCALAGFGQILPSPGATGPNGPPPLTLVSSTCQALGANGGTTTPINTTGANFITISLAHQVGASYTVSDSQSNGMNTINDVGEDSDVSTALIYPTVGTVSVSAYTVTVTGTAIFAGICIASWSGLTHGYSGSGAVATGTSTVTTSPFSPASAGSNLLVTSLGCRQSVAGSITVSAGYTNTSGSPQGSTVPAYCVGLAYKLQTGTAGVSVTWDQAMAADIVTILAGFY